MAVADDFLRTRLQECRRSTFDWYDERLSQIVAQYGPRMMDSVTRAELRAWLESLPHKAARAANARAARALWRWALAQEPPQAAQNITTGLTFTSAPMRAEIAVLTVEQCAAALKASGRHRSALALMLFAGIRPEEVCSAAAGKPAFAWSHVNVADRIIRIPAEVSKTGRSRVIENLPDALWRWLEPRKDGPISTAQARTVVNAAAAAMGLAGKWPQDALRHTFASYAVALTSDAGKVSIWLGHEGNPTMLHRHYRGIATEADARRFFGLTPA
jgi:integrase